jgi:hypothetical protein
MAYHGIMAYRSGRRRRGKEEKRRTGGMVTSGE